MTDLPASRADERADQLARLERWTELPLTVLALALIPLLLVPRFVSLSTNTQRAFDGADYLIWGVFAVDLIVKLIIAPARVAYLRRHWFDVALVAVPMLRPLRLARSVRLLRLLRSSRSGFALIRFVVGGRTVLKRNGLQYLLAAALVVVVSAGAFVTLAERSQDGATIKSLDDGLWWAATTVTTVGYGDTFPKSAVGRGVGVMLMLFGISMFGVITASVAAYFVEKQEEDSDLIREVRELRLQLQLLTERINQSEA